MNSKNLKALVFLVYLAASLFLCSCGTEVKVGVISEADLRNGYSVWRSMDTNYNVFIDEMISSGKERMLQIISDAEFYRKMDPETDRLPLPSDDESAYRKPFYSIWLIGENAAYRVDNWPKMHKAPGPVWEDLPIYKEKQTQANVLWIWRVDLSDTQSREETTRLLRLADWKETMGSGKSLGWYSIITDESEEEFLNLINDEDYGEAQKLTPGN